MSAACLSLLVACVASEFQHDLAEYQTAVASDTSSWRDPVSDYPCIQCLSLFYKTATNSVPVTFTVHYNVP
jgi:hypothetical protein